MDTTTATRDELIHKAEEDPFIRGYIACMLWADAPETEEGEREDNCTIDDLSDDLLRSTVADCVSFLESMDSALWEVSDLYSSDYGEAMERAGYDFWLTRQGHGAGFWDRGNKPEWKTLTDAAKTYGSLCVHLHDGIVYGS